MTDPAATEPAPRSRADLRQRRAVRGALRRLAELDLPAADVEGRLQQCLGSWVGEQVVGTSYGRPGDTALRRLVDEGALDLDGYRGDAVLALVVLVGLRSRGLDHPDLAALAGSYAAAVAAAGPADPDYAALALARVLLRRLGFDVAAPVARRIPPVDVGPAVVADRAGLLESCRRIGLVTAWGSCAVPTSGPAHLLPALATSYAMGWDLDAVCAILRACAYLGLQHEPGCAWAREWLVEQYEDGWFGLLLQECRAADLDPDGPRFPATVRALWTLAELRSPGFLLGADDGPVAPARMRVRPLDAQRVARRLLQPGSTAPPVRLPDLFGQGPADLADHRGRPVLLVFVDADCTPCTALVPALVELDRAPGGPDVFVVGHGEPARLRRLLAGQRPPFPVVAQEGWSVSRQYGIFTAPSAFLLGPDGVLGPPVARGPEVADLVARLAAEVGDLANLGAG